MFTTFTQHSADGKQVKNGYCLLSLANGWNVQLSAGEGATGLDVRISCGSASPEQLPSLMAFLATLPNTR